MPGNCQLTLWQSYFQGLWSNIYFGRFIFTPARIGRDFWTCFINLHESATFRLLRESRSYRDDVDSKSAPPLKVSLPCQTKKSDPSPFPGAGEWSGVEWGGKESWEWAHRIWQQQNSDHERYIGERHRTPWDGFLSENYFWYFSVVPSLQSEYWVFKWIKPRSQWGSSS